MLDVDTVASPGSFEAALHAAGGAVRAVDALLGGEAGDGLLRAAAAGPPRRARARDGVLPLQQRRGRGACTRSTRTASSACWCSTGTSITATARTTSSTARDEVLYASIHQSPLYPGTGSLSESGAGAGEGYTVNLPVPPGSGTTSGSSLVQHVVAPVARAYEPRLLLVSAGFDAHRDDPLASCMLTEETYAAMAATMRDARRRARRAAAGRARGRLRPRRAGALGRGHDGGGARRAAPADAPTAPLAEPRAAAHFARWWPVLAAQTV